MEAEMQDESPAPFRESSASGARASNDSPVVIEREDHHHMSLDGSFVGPASLERPPDLVPTFTDRPLSRVIRPRRLGALFVDFENIYISFSDMVTKPLEATIHVLTALRDELELQHDINVVLGRAYGSWEYGPARDALSQLSLLGIVPQYVLSRRHKSSADLKLSIDLMEVLLTRSDIACYIIVGGDRDYMPIVEKIKERAKDILIISPAQATSGDLIALVGMEQFIDAATLLPLDAEPVQVGGSPRVVTRTTKSAAALPTISGSLATADDDEDTVAREQVRTESESETQNDGAPSEASRPQARDTLAHGVPDSKSARESSSRHDTKSKVPETVHVDPKDEVEADRILRQYMHEYAIQDLWACVGLILRAQDEIRSAEIWVGPFLKNYMNETFDFMNNAQRKRLLKIMEEVGAITVVEKQDRMGEQTYSVLTINWENPIIKTGLVRRS